MDEAAPQPAAAIEHPLGMPGLVWGDEYESSRDPGRGLWAVRRGKIGPLATATAPEELGQKLADGPGACRRVQAVIVGGDREPDRVVHAVMRRQLGADGHLAAPAGAGVIRAAAAVKAGARA